MFFQAVNGTITALLRSVFCSPPRTVSRGPVVSNKRATSNYRTNSERRTLILSPLVGHFLTVLVPRAKSVWFPGPYRSMNSAPLVLPFTLSASDLAFEGSPDAPSCANVLIDQSSTITDVSCLTPYWLRSGLVSPSAQQFSSSDPLEGVALGCKDGTLYLLRQTHRGTFAPISIEKPLLSRSPSRTTAHLSRLSHSRPRTPNPSLSPFPLTSRARVVSAVSDEQAQAPKNYVDFDEEPEKLKDLLKGAKGSSSARLSSDPAHSTERQGVQVKGLASSSGPAPRGEGKLVLGAAHSPTPSISSLPSTLHTTPPSPFCPSYQLSLEFHVFPPHSVPGDAVVGLHALMNSRHLLCLRSQGFDDFIYLFLFLFIQFFV